jgi:hypothetical protein
MKKFNLKVTAAGLAAGLGLLFMGAAPASADTGPQSAASSGHGNGVIAGNSLAANVAIPIDIACNGNGVGIVGVGIGFSACGKPHVNTGPQQSASSGKGSGVGTGNSADVNWASPLTARCNGNGIGGAIGGGGGASVCDLWG